MLRFFFFSLSACVCVCEYVSVYVSVCVCRKLETRIRLLQQLNLPDCASCYPGREGFKVTLPLRFLHVALTEELKIMR